jgi:hypothetical protein
MSFVQAKAGEFAGLYSLRFLRRDDSARPFIAHSSNKPDGTGKGLEHR